MWLLSDRNVHGLSLPLNVFSLSLFFSVVEQEMTMMTKMVIGVTFVIVTIIVVVDSSNEIATRIPEARSSGAVSPPPPLLSLLLLST